MKMPDESKENLDLKQELSKMINNPDRHVPIHYINYPKDETLCLQCSHKDVCKISISYKEGVKKIKDICQDLPEALEVSYTCKFFIHSTLQRETKRGKNKN